jgi:hypothetical protein
MHGQVVRLVALDQVLRLFLRSTHNVTFERDFGSVLFPDPPPGVSKLAPGTRNT